MRDTAVQSEARAPTRTYAIRAREEATAPDVIADIFYLFDVTVYVLIDPGSTHSYICISLVAKKKLPVESTDYDIQVTNPLVGNYRKKRIDLKCQIGEMISVESENPKEIIRIILAFSTQRLMRKGNEAYLGYTQDSESKLEQLPVINEFVDVFPEELSSLTPDCEVEFVIDVVPRTTPISVTPYRMSQAELKELKAQL
ncbi:uncharacterized protein LOC128040420 [Gossypium raimondii]|uniref:uncharacterized protein LOC128040420 n=1 Tax=Gossypium raimondii TaxID=29730 RepID=UPI00227D4402|nr:uncharacterized protein LOC128040420 [Gossypium raimondii]